jgi:hypothetical protein
LGVLPNLEKENRGEKNKREKEALFHEKWRKTIAAYQQAHIYTTCTYLGGFIGS